MSYSDRASPQTRIEGFSPFTMLHNVYYLTIQGNHIGLFLTNPSPWHPVCLEVVCSVLFTWTFARDWIFTLFFFFSIIKRAFMFFFFYNLLFFHKVLKIWDSINQLNKLHRMKLIGRRYVLVNDYLMFVSYYNLWVWFVILVFIGPVISYCNFLWTLIAHEEAHSNFFNNFSVPQSDLSPLSTSLVLTNDALTWGFLFPQDVLWEISSIYHWPFTFYSLYT